MDRDLPKPEPLAPTAPSVDEAIRTLRDVSAEYLSFVRGFGEILDALERWGEVADPDTKNRVELLKKLGTRLLLEHGIRPTARVGGPVDLALHEVIRVDESSNAPPGTVVRIVQTGYEMGRMVLLRARVEVAPDGPSGPADKDADLGGGPRNE